jgi:hypothetical protein
VLWAPPRAYNSWDAGSACFHSHRWEVFVENDRPRGTCFRSNPAGCFRVTVVVSGNTMTINRRLLLAALASGSTVLAQTSESPSSTLKVGDKAPDFTLPSTDGGTVHLADLIGKSTIVLAFFPAAFTGG